VAYERTERQHDARLTLRLAIYKPEAEECARSTPWGRPGMDTVHKTVIVASNPVTYKQARARRRPG